MSNVPAADKRKYDTGRKLAYVKRSVAEGVSRGGMESSIFLIFNLYKIQLCKVITVIIIW